MRSGVRSATAPSVETTPQSERLSCLMSASRGRPLAPYSSRASKRGGVPRAAGAEVPPVVAVPGAPVAKELRRDSTSDAPALALLVPVSSSRLRNVLATSESETGVVMSRSSKGCVTDQLVLDLASIVSRFRQLLG